MITIIGTYANYVEIQKEALDLVNKFGVNLNVKSNPISLQYRDIIDWNCSNTPSCGYHEEEYCNIMPELKDSYIEDFLRQFNLVRARIFTIPPNTVGYSVHRDRHTRAHLPIQSAEPCGFVYYPEGPDGDAIEQPYMKCDGTVYSANTREFHTFSNNSAINRVHIVGSINTL